MRFQLLIHSVALLATTQLALAHEGGHSDEDYGAPKLIIEPLVYLNAVAGYSDLADSDLAHGSHDPAHNGFSLPSAALSLDFSYGEYLAAFAEGVAFWNEQDSWDAEIEELYIKAGNLPGGLELRAGRLLPLVGSSNHIHNHAWHYVDAQLGNVRFLGEDGLTIDGVDVSWSPNTSWDDQLSVSFGHSVNQNSEDEETALWDENILSLRYESTFWPSNDNSYRIGASYVQGQNLYRETSRLYGLDLTYSWLQDEDYGKRLIWTNEMMFRELTTDDGALNEFSFSSMAGYHLSERWEIGLRYDYLQGTTDPELPERHRISPAITHSLHLGSVASLVRLQYNYDHSETHKEDHSIWLQLNLAWGPGGRTHTN